MNPTAVIVGSGGQDGKLLLQLLESQNYTVIGLKRGDLDLLDANAVEKFLAHFRPKEIFFLAASHHSSEDLPDNVGDLFHTSIDTNVLAVSNFLNAIVTYSPSSRFFYAASSHIFGHYEGMQNEETP